MAPCDMKNKIEDLEARVKDLEEFVAEIANLQSFHLAVPSIINRARELLGQEVEK